MITPFTPTDGQGNPGASFDGFTFTPEQVAQGEIAKQEQLAALAPPPPPQPLSGRRVEMVGPDGEMYSLPEENAAKAQAQGYRVESPDERAAREFTKAHPWAPALTAWYKGAVSGATLGLVDNKQIGWLVENVAPLMGSKVTTEQVQRYIQKAQDEHGVIHGAGEVAAMLLTLPVASGAASLGVKGGTALATTVAGEAGAKVAGSWAGRTALEGLGLTLPRAFREAVEGDPGKAIESVAWGIGGNVALMGAFHGAGAALGWASGGGGSRAANMARARSVGGAEARKIIHEEIGGRADVAMEEMGRFANEMLPFSEGVFQKKAGHSDDVKAWAKFIVEPTPKTDLEWQEWGARVKAAIPRADVDKAIQIKKMAGISTRDFYAMLDEGGQLLLSTDAPGITGSVRANATRQQGLARARAANDNAVVPESMMTGEPAMDENIIPFRLGKREGVPDEFIGTEAGVEVTERDRILKNRTPPSNDNVDGTLREHRRVGEIDYAWTDFDRTPNVGGFQSKRLEDRLRDFGDRVDKDPFLTRASAEMKAVLKKMAYEEAAAVEKEGLNSFTKVKGWLESLDDRHIHLKDDPLSAVLQHLRKEYNTELELQAKELLERASKLDPSKFNPADLDKLNAFQDYYRHIKIWEKATDRAVAKLTESKGLNVSENSVAFASLLASAAFMGNLWPLITALGGAKIYQFFNRKGYAIQADLLTKMPRTAGSMKSFGAQMMGMPAAIEGKMAGARPAHSILPSEVFNDWLLHSPEKAAAAAQQKPEDILRSQETPADATVASYVSLSRDLAKLANDPTKLQARISDITDSLMKESPVVAAGVARHYGNLVAHLAKVMPPASGGGNPYAPTKPSYSKSELQTFAERMLIADDPHWVQQFLSTRTLKKEHMETLLAVWPSTYRTFVERIRDHAMSGSAKPIDYKGQLQLSLLTGVAMTPHASPQSIQGYQKLYVQENLGGAPGLQGVMKAANMSRLDGPGKGKKTSSQHIEER